MSKIRLLTLCVIALATMNLFFLARPFLHGPPFHGIHPPHGKKGGGDHMDRKLEFDENQIKKHADFRTAHRKASLELQKELNGELKNLYELIGEDAFPGPKKDSILRVIAGKTTEINDLNINHFLNIKSILKPEQVAGFNEMIGRLSNDFERRGPKNH